MWKIKKDIIYVSEDLTHHSSLKEKYKGLEFLKAIVTSDLPDKITELNSMFDGCSSLEDVDYLRNWNTQNVTGMSSMFCRCSSLVDLSLLSNWNVSKANKKGMFANCQSIKSYPSWNE